jgi:hypothetical protein
MDFDDIKFTEWQIDKIRVALNKYRITHVRNGRLISWTQVREDITGSDVNVDRYFEDDAELAFKPEALRRFAAEINVLELERLKDVTRFLLHDGILHIDMLDESKSGLLEFLALHDYLANNTEASQHYIKNIEGVYTCRKEHPDGRQKSFTLRLIPDPSLNFVRVDELSETNLSAPADTGAAKNKDTKSISTNRLGYGFPVSSLNMLHVFLNGVVPDSRITYVQASELCGNTPESGIFLLRSGEETGRNALPISEYRANAVLFPNIYLFSPLEKGASHER